MAGKKKQEPSNFDERLKELDKKYSTKTLSEEVEDYKNRRVYSTGCFSIDIASGAIDPIHGNGGIEERTTLEAFGLNQSLKTCLAEHTARSVLEDNEENLVVIVSPEKPNVQRMRGIGLDMERVRLLDCYHEDYETRITLAEYQLEALLEYARDPRVKLCIIDSVAALTPSAFVFDKNGKDLPLSESEKMCARASLITKFIIKFGQIGSNSILFMINQLKSSIGTSFIVGGNTIRASTPGGTGMDFAADLRIRCNSSILEFEHPLLGKMSEGMEGSFILEKNKYGMTTNRRPAHCKFLFEKWLDDKGQVRVGRFKNVEQVLLYSEFLGIVEKSGSFYTFDGERVQGKDNAMQYLEEHKELYHDIAKQVIARGEEFFEQGKPKAKSLLD